MSSHYVAWRGQVYRFDADTQKQVRAKAYRWLDAQGYGGHWWAKAHRGVA